VRFFPFSPFCAPTDSSFLRQQRDRGTSSWLPCAFILFLLLLPSSSSLNLCTVDVNFLESKTVYASSMVVFATAQTGEGGDRNTLSVRPLFLFPVSFSTDLPHLQLSNGADELINYVADRHNDTIVVITAPGPVDFSNFVDHANVSAILFVYAPTVEGGNAIASTLYGEVNPSGKLPFTVAANVSDYDSNAIFNETATIDPIANFTEGNFIDYRYFDKKNITPLYEFGFGLSYTSFVSSSPSFAFPSPLVVFSFSSSSGPLGSPSLSLPLTRTDSLLRLPRSFSFSDLKISSDKKSNKALVRETNEKFFVDGKETKGLYDYAYTVKATVKNTGSVAGAEVAQVRLSFAVYFSPSSC
jgi:beta-glucosidase